MTTLFSDTQPEAEQVLIDLLRRASVARKLEMLGQMNAIVRQLALQGLRTRHPRRRRHNYGGRYPADPPELAAHAYKPRPLDASHAT